MEHAMEKSQDISHQISIVIQHFWKGFQNGCQSHGR